MTPMIHHPDCPVTVNASVDCVTGDECHKKVLTQDQRTVSILRAPFIAIDFETANRTKTSAIQLAAVRVENGVVTATRSAFIKPPPGEWLFEHVHGLAPSDVESAPSFKAVWSHFVELFDGINDVWAHNGSFDQSVLEACLDAVMLPQLNVRWHCTGKLAQQLWKLRQWNLANVSEHLGISLNHHEALSDASACAAIVLRAKDKVEAVIRGES